MRTLDVLVALFAAFMLYRHGPRAVALLRGRAGPQGRAMSIASLVNVVLALLLLVLAVKGALGGLISR